MIEFHLTSQLWAMCANYSISANDPNVNIQFSVYTAGINGLEWIVNTISFFHFLCIRFTVTHRGAPASGAWRLGGQHHLLAQHAMTGSSSCGWNPNSWTVEKLDVSLSKYSLAPRHGTGATNPQVQPLMLAKALVEKQFCCSMKTDFSIKIL